MRFLLLTCGVALLLAAPASAAAATLDTDRSCFREGSRVRLSGDGFTPGSPIAITLRGEPYGATTADAQGRIEAIGRAPAIRESFESLSLRATDARDPNRQGTAVLRVTKLDVSVTPRSGGRANRRVTFRVRGFTERGPLYLHYLTPGGRLYDSVRLGRLRGSCGTLAVRRELIPSRRARPGRWRLRFDTRKRYSARTRPQVRLAVRVRREEG